MHKSPKLPWKHATLQNLFCYSQQQIQYQQWVKIGVRWMSKQKKWKGWELSKLRQNQHSQQRIFALSSNSQHNHWKQKLLSGNWALRTPPRPIGESLESQKRVERGERWYYVFEHQGNILIKTKLLKYSVCRVMSIPGAA